MLIYASSGSEYFSVHGEAFIASAEKHGHRVKVDLVDDFPEWKDKLHCKEERTFNSMLRTMRLPEMLDDDDVLVLDIDSIINKPIEMQPCDLALFFRPWMPSEWVGMQVLMTASYWTKRSRPFAERVRQRLLSQVNKWGDDQAAVWRTFQEMGHLFAIQPLTQDFVCYHFDRDAPIWTCKGPARKSSPIYLERRAQYAA